MSTKTFLISTVLFGVLLLVAAGLYFAGTSELLEQAQTYKQEGNYEQAEAIYQQIVSNYPGTDDALEAQKQLALIYIATDRQQQADAAFGQLVTDFYEHPGISQAVWQIAKEYEQIKKYDKALEFHQYNVERFSPDMYAMWSQVEIVYSLIDSDDAADADAACDKLITVFSEQETLPKEIHQVAMRYSGSGQSKKAYTLHQYNVEHFPDYKGLDVIWSQSELIRLDLQAGFYESACAGAKVLLGWPPDQNDLPREIHVTAKRFAEAGKHDKAYELYRYNIEHFPKDMYAMWSQVEIAYAHINGGDFAAADSACAQLMSLFSDQESLPKEVYQVAEAYNKANRSDKAVELCRYIVERWPSSDHALWAQRDLTIRSIDADDEFAAQAAVDKLLSDFCEHQGISQVIHAVAQHYERAKGNLEKALELHRYNVEHFSSDMYAMWSQVEIVYSHIRDGNDTGADEAFGKLVTLFAEQPTLPKEIYQVGDEYAKVLNYDKAGALYQYVIANWPDTEYEMWAKSGIIKLDIYFGNDANVQPALDQLIADYNDHPALPEAVFQIADEYYNKAIRHTKERRNNQANDFYLKAIAVWQKMIQELPLSAKYTPRAYYCSAVVYSQELGEYLKGIEYYQIIVDNWPDYKYAWHAQYFIGKYYEKLRDSGSLPESEANPKIEQTYEAVIKKYPDSKSAPYAALKLGRLNFEKSQWVDAAMYFELFLEKAPEDQRRGGVLYDLGRAYEEMGELDVAVQVYSIFIEIADPDDPRVKGVEARLEEFKE